MHKKKASFNINALEINDLYKYRKAYFLLINQLKNKCTQNDTIAFEKLISEAASYNQIVNITENIDKDNSYFKDKFNNPLVDLDKQITTLYQNNEESSDYCHLPDFSGTLEELKIVERIFKQYKENLYNTLLEIKNNSWNTHNFAERSSYYLDIADVLMQLQDEIEINETIKFENE